MTIIIYEISNQSAVNMECKREDNSLEQGQTNKDTIICWLFDESNEIRSQMSKTGPEPLAYPGGGGTWSAPSPIGPSSTCFRTHCRNTPALDIDALPTGLAPPKGKSFTPLLSEHCQDRKDRQYVILCLVLIFLVMIGDH